MHNRPKEFGGLRRLMGGMRQDAPDEALAGMAAGGDRSAFAVLLDRHYDRIYRIGYRFLGDRADAEDLTQDICVGLAQAIRSYRGKAKFSTWLYQVVVNRARDALRRRRRQRSLRENFAEVEALRRGDQADRERRTGWLIEALDQLRDDLRETAILVVIEGLSHREAGEVLGVREATVSWRLAEVRKALSDLVEVREPSVGLPPDPTPEANT